MSERIETQNKAIRPRSEDIHNPSSVAIQNSKSKGLEDEGAFQRSSFPRGLSFTFSESFARYPDTAESGETYDLEVSGRPTTDPVEPPPRE